MLKFTLKQYNVIALLALGFNSLTQAVPTLQLDIGGGYYNLADETVETFDNMFSVYAYATPGNTVTESSILAETYYLSIAVTPQLASASDLGTIYVNGTAINVTADMFYGNPPLDVTASNLDLPSHDIFDTYYAEIAFQFNPSNTSSIYNTMDNPGSGPLSGTGMFYSAFDIDASGLDPNIGLHFDLYNTAIKNRCECLTVDDFAPFSHDAAMVRNVPEPATVWLTSIGLLGLFGGVTKRKIRA